MSDHDYKIGGWKEKYIILERCSVCGGNGKTDRADVVCPGCNGDGYNMVDPRAVYFVLRLDEDPHARAAAAAYAQSIQGENPQFAIDIRRKLAETWKEDFGR